MVIKPAKYGIKSVCYRPFSGYGEDQDLNYPFPSICKRILKNKNTKKWSISCTETNRDK